MAYEKTNWVDNETPINATNLNKMEDGIVEASKTGGILAGSVIGWNGDTIPEGYEEVKKGYSTEEILTGETWIDGKPIYRKVIETLPNTTVTFANNVEMAWFKWGVLTVPVGETVYRFPINYSVEGREINAQITNNTVIVANTFEDWNTSSVTIVLEYTKTTD